MKKIFTFLTIFTLFFFSSCSKDSSEQETNSEKRIIRFDNSISEIAPKSIYMPNSDFQVTSYFKFNSQGNIERLSHLVGDDNSGTSTIISFNDSGIINSIYQQDGLTGVVSNEAFIKLENNTMYYGTEIETSESSTKSQLETYDFINSTNDDIILSNTLNQNIDILEHIKFISENSNRRYQSSQSAFLAAAVVIAIVVAIVNWVIEESDVTNCILSTETCNNGNRSSSSSQNNSCSPNYSQFICSSEDSISEILEISTNTEVNLCNGQICTVNEIGLSGVWYIDPTNNCGFSCCGDFTFIFKSDNTIEFVDVNNNGATDFNLDLISSNYTFTNNELDMELHWRETFNEDCDGSTVQVEFNNIFSILSTYNSTDMSFTGTYSEIATEVPETTCADVWNCGGNISINKQ